MPFADAEFGVVRATAGPSAVALCSSNEVSPGPSTTLALCPRVYKRLTGGRVCGGVVAWQRRISRRCSCNSVRGEGGRCHWGLHSAQVVYRLTHRRQEHHEQQRISVVFSSSLTAIFSLPFLSLLSDQKTSHFHLRLLDYSLPILLRIHGQTSRVEHGEW